MNRTDIPIVKGRDKEIKNCFRHSNIDGLHNPNFFKT